MCRISFLFFILEKYCAFFPVLKMTGSVHQTFLLNTTQSQWSQVPNTYMHTYLHTYIICQIKKKKKKKSNLNYNRIN